jgi:hypothetical protein
MWYSVIAEYVQPRGLAPCWLAAPNPSRNSTGIETPLIQPSKKAVPRHASHEKCHKCGVQTASNSKLPPSKQCTAATTMGNTWGEPRVSNFPQASPTSFGNCHSVLHQPTHQSTTARLPGAPPTVPQARMAYCLLLQTAKDRCPTQSQVPPSRWEALTYTGKSCTKSADRTSCCGHTTILTCWPNMLKHNSRPCAQQNSAHGPHCGE